MPEPEIFTPTFADVETEDGQHWTAVSTPDQQWRYLVTPAGVRVPWPCPPGDYRPGALVGEPERHEPLPCYTIYLNPIDVERPEGTDLYVMRKFLVSSDVTPTLEMWTAATIEELRDLVPWTCIRFAREPADDPNILESWF